VTLRARLRAFVDRVRQRFNPFLITTTYDGGRTLILKDRRTLTCRTGEVNNDNERTTWTEYWDGTLLVHRSAHVRLKKWPEFAESQQGSLQ
jgi:hypothetical protein